MRATRAIAMRLALLMWAAGCGLVLYNVLWGWLVCVIATMAQTACIESGDALPRAKLLTKRSPLRLKPVSRVMLFPATDGAGAAALATSWARPEQEHTSHD